MSTCLDIRDIKPIKRLSRVHRSIIILNANLRQLSLCMMLKSVYLKICYWALQVNNLRRYWFFERIFASELNMLLQYNLCLESSNEVRWRDRIEISWCFLSYFYNFKNWQYVYLSVHGIARGLAGGQSVKFSFLWK